MDDSLENETILQVAKRLLPFIFLCYFVCLIDRVNLSFAALTMNKDLGLSAYAYSLGASIFFIGYFIFEVPSNLALERLGARLWITRIMVTWGLVSAGTAFIQGETSFLVMRMLLGLAEAGFFPGMILYMTFWFPAAYRARVIAGFMLAIPVTGVIGGPLATSLMELNGTWGLAGWQWMFLAEGIPSVLIGCLVPLCMTDRPERARWLRDDQRAWLAEVLKRERQQVEDLHSRASLWRACIDPRVLALCLVYFGIGTATYGFVYFLPQVIKGLGLSNLQTGFVSAIPDVFGTLGMLIWGHFSDRQADRRWSVLAALFVCGFGLLGIGLFSSSGWSLIAMAMVSIGINASRPMFWALPSTFLTGTAAAGAIALINSVGNLGGIVGPVMLGWVKDTTNSFSGGFYFLAFWAFFAGIAVVAALRAPKRVAPAYGAVAE
jgi:ACS family tartrate transporter-like MFS transporter